MKPADWVAGATGFVGRNVVAQLLARGRRAVAHVRPDSSQLAQWQERFAASGAEVDPTPWELDALARRFAELRPSCLFLCIGTTQKRARADKLDGNPYELIDYGLTKLAVDAAVQAHAADPEVSPRVVYLSSIGAAVDARSAYLSWRGRAEEVVKQSGLPWMIARPSIITESASGDGARDDRRPAERAAAVVGDAALALLGGLGARKLRARYRSTTPDVLAAALIRLSENPAAGLIASGDDLR